MIDLFGFDYDQGGLAGPGAASRLRATGNELARSAARGVAGGLQQGSTNPAAASMAVNEVQRDARAQALQQALQTDAAYRQQQAGMARQTIMSGIGAAASLGAMAIPGAQAATPAVGAATGALGAALGNPAPVPAATPPPNPYGAPQNPVADATRQALTAGAADVGQQAQAMVSPAAGAGPAAAPAPQAPQAPAPAPAAPGVPPPIDVGATTQQIQTAAAPALNRAFDWARSSNPYDQPAPTQAQGQAPVQPRPADRPLPPPASRSVVPAGSTPNPRASSNRSGTAGDLVPPDLVARPGENWPVGGAPAAPGIPRGMDAPPPGGIGNAPGSTRSLIAPAPTLAPPGPALGGGGTALRPEYTVAGGGPAPARPEPLMGILSSPLVSREHPDARMNRVYARQQAALGTSLQDRNDPDPVETAARAGWGYPGGLPAETFQRLRRDFGEPGAPTNQANAGTAAAQQRTDAWRQGRARQMSRSIDERSTAAPRPGLPREEPPLSSLDLEPSPTASALARAASRGPAPADTRTGRVAEGAERALSRLLGRLTDLGIDPRSLF